MRATIDVSLLTGDGGRKRTGLGRFCLELFSAMLSEVKNDTTFTFVAAGPLPSEVRGVLESNRSRVRCVDPPGPFKRLWPLMLRMPVDLVAGRSDIIYIPGHRAPLHLHGRLIYTVHDLAFLRYPEHFEPHYLDRFVREFADGVRRSHLVICDSNHTQKDILTYYGLPEEKVKVVPLGVSTAFTPVSAEESRRVLGSKKPYILYTGTLETRKNLKLLIQAFALLPPALRNNYDLVLAGKDGLGSEGLRQLVVELGLDGSVRFTGYIPDNVLPSLMAGATLFVYPSFYEGFGLPPLEAMACGTPVIASDSSSLPEVVGDAGLLVAPGDVQGLKNAMARVLEDPAFQTRLRLRGLERAAQFSWRNAARSLLEIFESIARSR